LSAGREQIEPYQVPDRCHVSCGCKVTLFAGAGSAATAFGTAGIAGSAAAKCSRITI
jgi:hypothetical protein